MYRSSTICETIFASGGFELDVADGFCDMYEIYKQYALRVQSILEMNRKGTLWDG